MKKLHLITIFLCFSFSLLKAQNGGGCRKAISIVPGIYIVDSMIAGAATFYRNEPFPTKAKWYKYAPTQDGLLNISSCSGGADTRLFMYVGNCDSLSLFGSSDDYCTSGTLGDDVASDISKFVNAGKTYFFEWDNAWDTVKFSFILTFNANPSAVRETQTCSTAKTIIAGTMVVDSLFGYATHGDAARANWYKYTPKTNGKISISTCGEDVDTRIWVYKGACTALTKIAESDDDCDGTQFVNLAVALQDIPVVANTTYYLEWDDSWENNSFDFVLAFDATSALNDDVLSKSISLSPNPASDYVDLNFNFNETTSLNITIYNTFGQAVLSKKMDSILLHRSPDGKGIEKLDIHDLTSGLYIIEITEGAKHTNKKLIINR